MSSIRVHGKTVTMMRSQRVWILALVSAGCVLPRCPSWAGDIVRFDNANTRGEIGILVDGTVGGTAINDESHTASATGEVDVGDMDGTGEVISFQSQRPVSVTPADWSSDVRCAFADEQQIGVHVWVTSAISASRFNRVVGATSLMGRLWWAERVGAMLGNLEIHFVESSSTGGESGLSSVADFKCYDVGCHEAENLRSKAGFTSGAVNVYYVDRVDYGAGFSHSNGVWCGDDTIVLGSEAMPDLLVHEFGHALGLDHVDGFTGDFDETNVMWQLSSSRKYLTEGQLFRSQLDPDSVINTTYALRSGLETRDCGYGSDTKCPALDERIWSEP